MDSAANEQFATELMQGIGSFLGLPVNATTSLLTELLYAIESQVRIMEQLNNQGLPWHELHDIDLEL